MKRIILAFLFASIAWLASEQAFAANRFAVCSTTCTWDASSTAMWAATSGGATGATAPGTSDAVIFDASTCVGGTTCTITLNAPSNVQSISSGACTASTAGCIIENSVNNSSITLSASAGWNNSGTGTRTVKLGSATYTMNNATCSSNLWNWTTQTNLTLTPGTSTLNFSGTYTGTTSCSFGFGAATYATVSFSGAGNRTGLTFGGSFGTLNFTAPGSWYVGAATTVATINIAASNSSPFLITSATTTPIAVTLTSAASLACVGIHAITFVTTTPSFTGWDFGQNTNIGVPTSCTGGGGGSSGILRPGIGL